MKVIKYYWLCWDAVRPQIEYITNNFPCFVSVCRAVGYVRIECRAEDKNPIVRLLKDC